MVTQFSFTALGSPNSSGEDPVLFNWEVLNPGGHYNPSTGYYTVPYDGIYQFHVQMAAESTTSTVVINIKVHNSYTGSHVDTWCREYHTSATLLLDLQAGQTVSVHRETGAYGDPNYLLSYFWGSHNQC